MVRFLLIIIVVALTSCGKAKLRNYESIVQTANRFEIVYASHSETVSEQEVVHFKDILISDVKPEMKRKFITDVRVDIYKGYIRTGSLTMSLNRANGFVNFNSDSLNFGFPMTYRMGMYIGS